MRRLALTVMILASGAGAVGACQRHEPVPSKTSASSEPSVPKPKAPLRAQNVFLITIDALRADQPWTGYDKVATPNLSRLAAKSVVYTRAYSVAHLTTPSLNGMLASRYPSGLARTTCIFATFDIEHSLAPQLKAANIRTFAAHGHALFAGATAPSIGFDEWQLVPGAAGRMQAEGAVTGGDTARLILEYIERDRPAGRSFVWSHFVDPHDSYVAHDSFPPSSRSPRASYDSEVAYTDSVIGKVLDGIERTKMAGDTAIVVTADHGESFGEHGTTRHGSNLYEEEIRVPLMLYVPGLEPRTVDVPRSTIDVAPTIAELFGVTPPSGWEGKSLLHDGDGAAPEARAVMVDVPSINARPPKRAVILGSSKVIFTGAVVQVFDLARDPGERSPIAPEAAPELVQRARQELDRIPAVEGKPCDQAMTGDPEGA